MNDEFRVHATETSITVDLDRGQFGQVNELKAVPLGKSGIMIFDSNNIGVGAHESSCFCDASFFKMTMLGKLAENWTGQVVVKNSQGIKKFYIKSGEIVFASSDVINDRLGEVIYRQGLISLDELTYSSAKVSPQRKFGQVLLNQSVFTNFQLWAALKLQVTEILRSVFMEDQLLVTFDDQQIPAPIEVVFERGSQDLVKDLYSFGATFRLFKQSLSNESRIVFRHDSGFLREAYPEGTFIGDAVTMLFGNSLITSFVTSSHLSPLYSEAILFEMINMGICEVEPQANKPGLSYPELALIKSKIDVYDFIIASVKKSCSQYGVEFPIADLSSYVQSLSGDSAQCMYIDELGNITRECKQSILNQCDIDRERVPYYLRRIEGLIQFVLQIAMDNLEREAASGIKRLYLDMSN